MGFLKRWDINDIKSQLNYCAAELLSPYNDGFVSWGCKKDLYTIKFYIDSILESSPKFSCEEEFLKNQEQEKLIHILQKE